jgi:hypothetical protein
VQSGSWDGTSPLGKGSHLENSKETAGWWILIWKSFSIEFSRFAILGSQMNFTF